MTGCGRDGLPWLERFEQRQLGRRIGWCCVAGVAQFPASMASALAKENVVIIEVRSDAAARCRNAYHQVVDPPARYESGHAEPAGEVRQVLVHILYQQRPVPVGQGAELVVGKRATFEAIRGRIPAAFREHQPRFDIRPGCKPRQLIRGQRRQVRGQCEWLAAGEFLPVIRQEAGGESAAVHVARLRSDSSPVRVRCRDSSTASSRAGVIFRPPEFPATQ